MERDKALSYIGLCKKAGRLTAGTELTRAAVRSGKVALVLLASDAGPTATKRAKDMCAHFHVKLVNTGYLTVQLGDAAGRPPAAMLGICDAGFAEAIEKQLSVDTGDNI